MSAVTHHPRRKIRLIRRRRQVRSRQVAFALLLTIAAVCSLAMAAAPRRAASVDRRPLLAVTVDRGDSLWGLVARYGPKDRDIRLMIDEVLRINGLASPELQPGQVVLIPGP